MKPEPHHTHLAEMRGDRVVDELREMAAIAAVPCRALTGAELQAARARYVAGLEAKRLRQCYPDPTRRHLAEMRMARAREEVRRACDTCAEYGEICGRHGSERNHG